MRVLGSGEERGWSRGSASGQVGRIPVLEGLSRMPVEQMDLSRTEEEAISRFLSRAVRSQILFRKNRLVTSLEKLEKLMGKGNIGGSRKRLEFCNDLEEAGDDGDVMWTGGGSTRLLGGG